jgi:DNA-binding GntR family transcriptional regulator
MAAEAAVHATAEDVVALDEEILTAEAMTSTGVVEAWAEFRDHDTRFHEMVAQMSGNIFVTEAFERTHCHWNMARAVQASLRTSLEATQRGEGGDGFLEAYPISVRTHALVQHRSIFEAIKARDSSAARQQMTNHVESSRQRFQDAVERISS